MAMTRVWQKGAAKVEEHQFRDGTFAYSLRDRLGRPHDLDGLEEAERVIKAWGMKEVTEKYREAGWIQ